MMNVMPKDPDYAVIRAVLPHVRDVSVAVFRAICDVSWTFGDAFWARSAGLKTLRLGRGHEPLRHSLSNYNH